MSEPVYHLSFWDRLSEDIDAGRLTLKSDNVLVRIDSDQGDLARGSLIVTPGTAKREAARGLLGTVVAVGPGHHPEIRTIPERAKNRGDWDTSPTVLRQLHPTTVKVGERVVLESQLAGDEWPLRQGPHRLVREAEILAVLEWEESDSLLDLGAS